MNERDWDKFHTLENLSKSVSIEAAELLEQFQWQQEPDVKAITDEVADVLTYSYLLCMKLGVSPTDIVVQKLLKTEQKYPIQHSKGTSKKYTERN